MLFLHNAKVRIWDLPLENLCRQHLLGEHRELHALWTILTERKGGYKNHPETKRWVGKLGALAKRHDDLVIEMEKRGYRHNSPLKIPQLSSSDLHKQDTFLHTIEEQLEILRQKGCDCILDIK